MSDETDPRTEPSTPPLNAGAPDPAGVRAVIRQALKRAARRDACFELLSAGYTHQEIARRLKVSVTSLRRDVARAIEDRRLDAPERYVHFQVDRLTRALRSMDDRVEQGDTKAVGPYIHLVGALDRYHGLDIRYPRNPSRLARPSAPPASLALSPPADFSVKSSESDTQVVENMGA
jgi:hypothetical protein